MAVTVNLLLNYSGTKVGFNWLKGFLEHHYSDPPIQLERQELTPFSVNYKCKLGDQNVMDITGTAIATGCIRLDIFQALHPSTFIQTYGQELHISPDFHIGSLLIKLKEKVFFVTSKLKRQDGAEEDMLLNWKLVSGVIYYEKGFNPNGGLISTGKTILDLSQRDWQLVFNSEIELEDGGFIPYQEIRNLAFSAEPVMPIQTENQTPNPRVLPPMKPEPFVPLSTKYGREFPEQLWGLSTERALVKWQYILDYIPQNEEFEKNLKTVIEKLPINNTHLTFRVLRKDLRTALYGIELGSQEVAIIKASIEDRYFLFKFYQWPAIRWMKIEDFQWLFDNFANYLAEYLDNYGWKKILEVVIQQSETIDEPSTAKILDENQIVQVATTNKKGKKAKSNYRLARALIGVQKLAADGKLRQEDIFEELGFRSSNSFSKAKNELKELSQEERHRVEALATKDLAELRELEEIGEFGE